MESLSKEASLLSITAKQSVEVSKSKRICGEVATYVGQMKDMLGGSKRDQEVIIALRSEVDILKEQKGVVEAAQTEFMITLTATVDALTFELSALNETKKTDDEEKETRKDDLGLDMSTIFMDTKTPVKQHPQ